MDKNKKIIGLIAVVIALMMIAVFSYRVEAATTAMPSKNSALGSVKIAMMANDNTTLRGSWNESAFMINGKYAYCADPFTRIQLNTRTLVSAKDYTDPNTGRKLTDEDVKRLATGLHTIWASNTTNDSTAKYFIAQVYTWRTLSAYWGWNINNTHFNATQPGYNDAQAKILNEAMAAASGDMSRIEGNLYFWVGANGQNLMTYDWKMTPPPDQQVKFRKQSEIPRITNGNSLYSIEGCQYGMYSDAACTRLIDTIDFDIEGNGGVITLTGNEDGKTYYFKEIHAPEGYYIDETVYSVTVYEDDVTYTIPFRDVPANDPIGLLLEKEDDNTHRKEEEGDGTLEGAIYGVWYYDEYADYDPGETGSNAFAYWEFKTDKNGCIRLDNAHRVGGDALFINENGDPCIPLGTIVVMELEPPVGYLINQEKYVIQITIDGDKAYNVHTTNRPTDDTAAKEMVIKGGVRAEKWDKELDLSEAIGGKDHTYSKTGATLEGIEFTIVNQSKTCVQIDGIDYQVGQEICKLYTKWDDELKAYTVETPSDYLPYGTYTIQETKTNDSYLLTDGAARTFEIREDGEIVTVNTRGEDLVFKDYIKRQDILFNKIKDATAKRMKVAFAVKNVTTGETHVVVTDHNGETDTRSTWNPHSLRTNANDKLLEYGETLIPTSAIDEEAGVWFGLGEDGHMAPVRDDFGALPYGDYEIWELPCEDNEGDVLLSWKFRITRNMPNRPVNLGTNTDDAKFPKLWTQAWDTDTKSQMALLSERVALSDMVHLTQLQKGKEYTLTATFFDNKTGYKVYAEVDGKYRPVGGSVTFTANNTEMDVEVPFSVFDGNKIRVGNEKKTVEGILGVIYESLTFYDETGEKHTVEHFDIDDEKQWIYFPKISTTATDSETEDHIGKVEEKAVIKDVVAYENLFKDETYVMRGKLYDKETGEPLLDAEGNEITAEKEFVAEGRDGSVELTFEIDATLIKGKTTVVFEELYYKDRLIETHADIEDEGQSVHYPDLGTKAIDKESGTNLAIPNEKTVIIDTVKYKNLIPGKEYTVKGVLMNKETGEVLMDEFGHEIREELVFTPEKPDGEVEMEFVFDSSDLKGQTVVVFEDLYFKGINIVSHADIEDKDQSITFEEPEEPDEPDEPDKPNNPNNPNNPDKPNEPDIPKTGDDRAPVTIWLLAAGVLTVTLAIRLRRKRK